jgi:SAM-dependent methyltransferase
MSSLAQVLTRSTAPEYDALAPHYDAFTAHPDYADWVRSLEALARRHGLHGRRALDLGCGTGSSLLPLVELGYEAVGCDASAGMVAVAKRKLAGTARLVVADARDLPALGSFDLVWLVNDTVNYLVGDGDLRRAIAAAAARLAPGGVLLFDANTLATYASFFARTHARETAALMMVWIGSGDEAPRPGATACARLEVFERVADGAWQRTTSRHRQRHHPDGDVRTALDAAGLQLLAVHGLTADGAIEDDVDERRHVKAIYVATHDDGERR